MDNRRRQNDDRDQRAVFRAASRQQRRPQTPHPTTQPQSHHSSDEFNQGFIDGDADEREDEAEEFNNPPIAETGATDSKGKRRESVHPGHFPTSSPPHPAMQHPQPQYPYRSFSQPARMPLQNPPPPQGLLSQPAQRPMTSQQPPIPTQSHHSSSHDFSSNNPPSHPSTMEFTRQSQQLPRYQHQENPPRSPHTQYPYSYGYPPAEPPLQTLHPPVGPQVSYAGPPPPQPLYGPPPIFPQYQSYSNFQPHLQISDNAILTAVDRAGKAKKLTRAEDWTSWTDHIRVHLRTVGLWTVLTGEAHQPSDPYGIDIWNLNQERLKSMLYLACGTTALTTLRINQNASASQQFQALKAKYDILTITSFNKHFAVLYRAKLSDYKDYTAYGNAIIEARNQLNALDCPQSELAIACSFMQGLGADYAAWRETYQNSWDDKLIKYDSNGHRSFNVPSVEDIMIKLDSKTTQHQLEKGDTKANARAFGAKDTKPIIKGKDASSSTTKEKKRRHCDTCFSDNHNTDRCWYEHPELQNEKFKTDHPTPESLKQALEKARKTQMEWHRTHPKKNFFIASKAIEINTNHEDRDVNWYADCAAGIHMTYDLDDFISTSLDTRTEPIETASGELLHSRGAGTAYIPTLIDGVMQGAHVKDVHYVPELSCKLLSLGGLTQQGCKFVGDSNQLYVYDRKGDVILQSSCNECVYPIKTLNQIGTPIHTAFATKTAKPESMDLWHQRLGHVNPDDLVKLEPLAEGMILKDKKTNSFCEACALGKQHKVHSKDPPTNRAIKPGQRLHADIFGGGNTLPGVGGYHYGAVVIDDATRMRFPIVLKTKDGICDEVPPLINRVENHTGTRVTYFRTDDGREYTRLQPVFNEKRIVWEKSAPYAQDQDGVSERSIRTILEMARTMMIQANLPHRLWPEVISAACYLRNRLPTKALDGKTPYEAWTGKKPNLSNLRVYGCDAYVIDYNAKAKGKMAPRSWPGTIVGYEAKNQWRIYDGKDVYIRRDVKFNEANLTYRPKHDATPPQNESPSERVGDLINTLKLAPITQPVGDILVTDAPNSADQTEEDQPNGANAKDSENGSEIQDDPIRNSVADLPPSAADHSFTEPITPPEITPDVPIRDSPLATTRSPNPSVDVGPVAKYDENSNSNPLIVSGPRAKRKHDYKQMHTKGFAKVAKQKRISTPAHGIVTPMTFREAIEGPQSAEWWGAMKAEVLDQIKRGTFRITKPPYDQKVIDGKWVYKIKENPDGTIARFKARWVAKGYLQVEGRDYQNKSAPVIRSDTTRILLAIAAKKKWKMRQYDVVTAFLYGKMDKLLYTKEPDGFKTDEGNACLLNTALYGLVQSAHLWFSEVKETLLSAGLTQSKHDDSLFFDIKKELYITVYVDDIKAYSPHDDVLDQISSHLSTKYELKDLGDKDVSQYLGMEIKRHPDGSIMLSQAKYIKDLLQRYGMEDCRPVSTPMTQVKLSKAPDGYVCDPHDLTEYQTLIGELMHLMVQTRADIAQAICRLAQFMANPTNEHWIALKRILRYLQGTQDWGTFFSADGDLTLTAWSDASWGEDPDDSRSTTGYVMFMAGGPIAWKSTKQQSVALSSTEAEYMAQTLAATNVMWVRGLLDELQIEGIKPTQPTIIYADNQGAIKLAENPVFQKRTKHIAIKYHYTRDLVKSNEIKLIYRPTAEMIADGLTKPLGEFAFSKYRKELGLKSAKSGA